MSKETKELNEFDLIMEQDEYMDGLFSGIEGIFASILMIIEVLVFGVIFNDGIASQPFAFSLLMILCSIVVFVFSLNFIKFNLDKIQSIDKKIEKIRKKERQEILAYRQQQRKLEEEKRQQMQLELNQHYDYLTKEMGGYNL